MCNKLTVVAQRLVEEKQRLVEEKQQFRQHLAELAATNQALEKQLALITYASAKGYPLSTVVITTRA